MEYISSTSLGDAFFTKEINIPSRAFDEGFPGVTDRFEWFGIIYEGEIIAPSTGIYTFKFLCDDGAVLYIDGNVVVNGDGVHPPTTFLNTISLVEGQEYDFMLKYFQGPRYHIVLVLEAEIPGGEMKLFNMNDFE